MATGAKQGATFVGQVALGEPWSVRHPAVAAYIASTLSPSLAEGFNW